MSPAIAAMSRRTFLTVTSVATVATAMPAAAAVLGARHPIALASHRSKVPADWNGSVVVLSGDYSARLAAVRQAIRNAAGQPMALFLDGADTLLFDIAAIDERPHLRPLLIAATPTSLFSGATA